MLRGVELAVAQRNAKGGLLGRQIAIIQADDQASPTVGVTVANMVVADHAVAVIGPYNSSVGIKSLPIYTAGMVVPVQMTSTDQTTGEGVTVQPKNSQISPVEVSYIDGLKPTSVAMLVDPSTYTAGMASRLATGLTAKGVRVSSTPITAGKSNYLAQVTQVLLKNPSVVYLSTYYPEGAKIANELLLAARAGSPAICFAGLANQDPGFVKDSSITAARHCTFSGVPSPQDLPSAAAYTKAYVAKYGVQPGTWGTFTYDSANILFAAVAKTKSTGYQAVLSALQHATGVSGATGPITIDPATGNRTNVPVKILKVNSAGQFKVAG